MRKPIALFLVINFIAIIITALYSFAADNVERIILTTYYPAPYGVYKEMRVDQLAVGSVYRYYSGPGLTDGNMIVSSKTGIGTANPQAPLHVYLEPGNVPAPNAIFDRGGGQNITISSDISGNKIAFASRFDNPKTAIIETTGDGPGNLTLKTAGATRVILTADGKMGIGTDNPKEKLTIGGSDKSLFFHMGGSKVIADNAYSSATSPTGWKYDQDGAASRIHFMNGSISLQTAIADTTGSQVNFLYGIHIAPNGNVGISTTSDSSSKLFVNSGTSAATSGIKTVKGSAVGILGYHKDNWDIGVYGSGDTQTPTACTGTALPCDGLSHPACNNQDGCYWNHLTGWFGACEGIATTCNSYIDPGPCQGQPNCLWTQGNVPVSKAGYFDGDVMVNGTVCDDNGCFGTADSIMYLRATAFGLTPPQTPANCPDFWIQADYKEDAGSHVRTCYRSNISCRVMYLRATAFGLTPPQTPANCPSSWIQADYKEDAGSHVRACFRCNE